MLVGVIGAGINGLSCATAIQNALPDADVTIITAAMSPDTTGDLSAGYWMPVCVGDGAILRWGQETYHYLLKLAMSADGPKCGAQIVYGYILNDFEERGNFTSYVYSYRKMTEDELSLYPQARHGIFFMSIIVDCVTYLPWLTKQFVDNGGRLILKRLTSLSEVADDYDVIVNCCGLGALSLLNDHEMEPIRGQVIKVTAPWIKHFVLDYSNPNGTAYIFPGTNMATVGGTFYRNNSDTSVDERDSQEIWNRCTKLLPQLTHAKIIKTIVGLRPFRSKVRLELEYWPSPTSNTGRKSTPVIHNYGHGGSGVTLFIGCANDVVKILRSLPVTGTFSQTISKL